MNPLTQAVTDAAISSSQRIELNSADVAAKDIDGEILVMNVANGMYYSLDGAGAVAWRLLVAGHSLLQTADVLASSYGVAPAATLDDVTDLAIQLVDEGLVAVSGASTSTEAPALAAFDVDGPYTVPRLNSYSDMADLLALDPPMPGLAETTFIPPEEV
jgi:hypothetical protein